MTIYIDTEGKLHDDDEGRALNLPSWPLDAMKATESQIDEITKRNTPDPRESMIVTSAQAQAAIAESNITLYNSIIAYMAQDSTAINDKIFWNKAQTFKRLSPTIIRLAAQFNLSETDLDNLFTLAATKDA